MQTTHTPRSIGLLIVGVAIATAIALAAPAPVALILPLVALPVEAFLITAAIHGLTKPKLAARAAR